MPLHMGQSHVDSSRVLVWAPIANAPPNGSSNCLKRALNLDLDLDLDLSIRTSLASHKTST